MIFAIRLLLSFPLNHHAQSSQEGTRSRAARAYKFSDRSKAPKLTTTRLFLLFILSLMAMLPSKLGRLHLIERRPTPSIYPRNGPSQARVRQYAQRQLPEVAAEFL